MNECWQVMLSIALSLIAHQFKSDESYAEAKFCSYRNGTFLFLGYISKYSD